MWRSTTRCTRYCRRRTVTFEAYVSGVEDELKRMGDGFNRWGGLTVTFTAMSPKRRP